MIKAQLNVLERQNRTDEFLQLCLETGQYLRYILKQIEAGGYDQAVAMAKTLTQASEALLVAKGLRHACRLDDALQLAEKGLRMDGSKHDLGVWLGPIEETQGRVQQAIEAYQAAFTSLPSLELYQTLEKLSGQNWESSKPALMRVFEGDRFADEMVNIYLFEEKWDAAIAAADRLGDWQYNLVEKVADGVISVRPDWVIQTSRKQTQGFDRKNSKQILCHRSALAYQDETGISGYRKKDGMAGLPGWLEKHLFAEAGVASGIEEIIRCVSGKVSGASSVGLRQNLKIGNRHPLPHLATQQFPAYRIKSNPVAGLHPP